VFYATRINPVRARMALNEIHIFLGTNFLVTVHDQEIEEVASLIDLWRETPDRWPQSAGIAHALLDSITDSYFPLVEYFSTKIEAFEDQIFTEAPEVPLQRVALLRQELIHFRRILAPERDVLSSFLRRDLPFVSPELVPYFQDVHDHVLRATEEIDSFRDLLTGLLEIQASNNAKQLNQTMQTLTSWSIILMSMALISGIYGMNFTKMPELMLPWGYFAALGLMAMVGTALIAFFRRRRWL
jgi:magnesium transporter